MDKIQTIYGSYVGQILPDRAYWALKTKGGNWHSELDTRLDMDSGLMRPYDWTKDLLDNDECKNIAELWLFCPPNKYSPEGNTARLVIEEPYTAFQFKVATMDGSLLAMGKTVQAQVIGKVTDKATGACECFIFDYGMNGLYTPETWSVHPMRDPSGPGWVPLEGQLYQPCKQNSVLYFDTWREGIAPPRALSLDALGVRLA